MVQLTFITLLKSGCSALMIRLFATALAALVASVERGSTRSTEVKVA